MHDNDCIVPEVEETESVVDSVKKAEDYKVLKPEVYMCMHCLKIYKQLLSLTKHLSKNHNIVNSIDFKCELCLKVFETKKKLIRHGNCNRGESLESVLKIRGGHFKVNNFPFLTSSKIGTNCVNIRPS